MLNLNYLYIVLYFLIILFYLQILDHFFHAKNHSLNLFEKLLIKLGFPSERARFRSERGSRNVDNGREAGSGLLIIPLLGRSTEQIYDARTPFVNPFSPI